MKKTKTTVKKSAPTLYIIAGPNGAGKTSLAKELLPKFLDCYDFINADYLALGLSPLSPDRAAIKAGRLMLKRILELSKAKQTFALETTLAGKTYLNTIRRLKKKGYKIDITFLWLPSVAIAIERVKQRVSKGGHNIPDEVIERRFKAGIVNFLLNYSQLADSWCLLDAATHPPERIVKFVNGKKTVLNSSKFAIMTKPL